MSILFDTSQGFFTVDLFVPYSKVQLRFFYACFRKRLHNCLIDNVQKDYVIQVSGDELTDLELKNVNQYKGKVTMNRPEKHKSKYYVSCLKETKKCGFVVQMNDNWLKEFDDNREVIGKIGEGFEVFDRLSNMVLDTNGRPIQIVRIRHVHILENPFSFDEDRPLSPLPITRFSGYLDENVRIEATDLSKQKEIEQKKAKLFLDLIEESKEENTKENVLFVANLNPITTEESLKLFFSSCGPISEVQIKKHEGSQSSFAFVEFQSTADCERAYTRMNNALIDDRTITVDFCHSKFGKRKRVDQVPQKMSKRRKEKI